MAINLGIDDLMFADICKLKPSFVFANFGLIADDICLETVFSSKNEGMQKPQSRNVAIVYAGRHLQR